jgi:XapX domain-containing protein
VTILQALGAGVFVGSVFAVFRLTPPAPPSWAGVAGIVGIVLAWQVVGKWVS